MNLKETYYVERNGTTVWLGCDSPLQDTDKVIEKRNVLVAEDGYTLWKDEEEQGPSVWIVEGSKEDYTEKPVVIEEDLDGKL